MPTQLNRATFEKLIAENIEAVEECKEEFTDNGHRLEWEHTVDVLKQAPALYYGVVRAAIRVHPACICVEQCVLCEALRPFRGRVG